MNNYNELDTDSTVKAILQTPGTFASTNMIQVAEYDISYLGKTYKGNGVFLDERIPTKIITTDVFWGLLSSTEQEALATNTQPKAVTFKEELKIRKSIDLLESKTQTKLNAMVTAGILSSSRPDEIIGY